MGWSAPSPAETGNVCGVSTGYTCSGVATVPGGQILVETSPHGHPGALTALGLLRPGLLGGASLLPHAHSTIGVTLLKRRESNPAHRVRPLGLDGSLAALEYKPVAMSGWQER